METKILANWPFEKMGSPVLLIEGWIYSGNIGDTQGAMHKALDFVRKDEKGEYIPFNIYAMHDGVAFQGNVDSWGPFVLIRKKLDETHWIDTLYGHLDDIPASIPMLAKSDDGGAVFPEEVEAGKAPVGLPIKAGDLIGTAGTKGDSHDIPQLHLELQVRGPETASLGLGKRDPLGIYDYKSREIGGDVVEIYPQPGEDIGGRPHYFTTDSPPFASPK